MSTDIVTVVGHQQALPAQYKSMVARINETMPAVARDTANFGKSHSQFMAATLDVTQLTTIRAVKHTLAEIARTRQALSEACIKQRRRDVDVREARERLRHDSLTSFDRERVEIDVMEAESQAEAVALSVQGAVRKLSYMVAQYNALMAKLGKDELTEADYEADEARYHVMTALKQALCAARARGGVIDEGNQIYLFDMGLPAAEVQAQLMAYLNKEQDLLGKGQAPTHEMTMQWLEACADRWSGCAAQFAVRRGVPLFDAASLHSA